MFERFVEVVQHLLVESILREHFGVDQPLHVSHARSQESAPGLQIDGLVRPEFVDIDDESVIGNIQHHFRALPVFAGYGAALWSGRGNRVDDDLQGNTLVFQLERNVFVRTARTACDTEVLSERKLVEFLAVVCGFLGRTGLSILEAKVHTTRHGYALDTFLVHDPQNPGATYRDAIAYLEHELTRILVEQAPVLPPEPGRVSRRVRHFPLSPQVQMFPDDKGTHYILEIVAADRPGLLARIAYVLAKANVNVVSAKINTLGERAEDVFLIDGARLHDEQALLRLETVLYEQLRV